MRYPHPLAIKGLSSFGQGDTRSGKFTFPTGDPETLPLRFLRKGDFCFTGSFGLAYTRRIFLCKKTNE
jgi:hypothetical protein